MSEWRARHHLVEVMPWYKLVNYLRFEVSSALALIDAIVCSANGISIGTFRDREFEMNYPLEYALLIAAEVRALPDECTMRDGRKWRSVPFIIFHSPVDHHLATWAKQESHAHLFVGMHHFYAGQLMLFQIDDVVRKHHQALLQDYETCGILVRFEGGRAQIKQALRRQRGKADTDFYHARGDRRKPGGWVTFSRDYEGLGRDVELFEELLSRKATETEMHRFFAEHPAVLMEARGGVPLSHGINFTKPKNWKPDFGFSSILGPVDGELQLLELKGPDEQLVTRGFHPGFTRKVHAAVDQVRDYERALRDPANFEAIRNRLGFQPDGSRLAVLIGRTPESELSKQAFRRRKEEIDVQIVTYDEVFATQACQL